MRWQKPQGRLLYLANASISLKCQALTVWYDGLLRPLAERTPFGQKGRGIRWPLCGQTTTGTTLWHKISILKRILSKIHSLLWSRTNLANLDIPSEAVPTLSSQSALIIGPQCSLFSLLLSMKLHISLSSRVWKGEVCEVAPVTAARPNVSSNLADTWSQAANSDACNFFYACFGVPDKEVNTYKLM